MALGPNWTELKEKKTVFKQYILGLEFPQTEQMKR